MNGKRNHNRTALFLSLFLAAVLALSGCNASGCAGDRKEDTPSGKGETVSTAEPNNEAENASSGESNVTQEENEGTTEEIETTPSQEESMMEGTPEETEESARQSDPPSEDAPSSEAGSEEASDALEGSTAPEETKNPNELPERPA